MASQRVTVEIDCVEHCGSFEIEGHVLTVKTADAETAVLFTIASPEGLARTLLRKIATDRAAEQASQEQRLGRG